MIIESFCAFGWGGREQLKTREVQNFGKKIQLHCKTNISKILRTP